LQPSEVNIHADLIERCRVGDRQAHYEVYRLYKRAMFNTAWRIVGDREEAEDVLQEAFVSAFRSLDFFRGDAPFGAWLKRIVVNKAISWLKRRKWERLPEDDRWDVPEESTGSEDELFPVTVQQVRTAIESLPDGYRAVLSLYLLEGYDHAEIGEILGISESTSKSQFNRSKKRLKELLLSRSYETR
jgi:RNA polymerase sigma-70 factor (ECF subfamily)